jgi:hypothetical protein
MRRAVTFGQKAPDYGAVDAVFAPTVPSHDVVLVRVTPAK